MIFDGWTIELEHATAGTYTPTQLIATDLQFSVKEEDIPFVLRAYLEQEIIFRGADFEWIKAIDDSEDRCEDIKMTIGNGSLELVYYLPLPGAKFDVDLKEVPMKAKINDAYRCILDSWEDEFNLLDYADPVTIRPYIGTLQTNAVTDSFVVGVGETIDDYLTPATPPTVDPTDPSWRLILVDFTFVDPFTGTWSGLFAWVRETFTTACVAGSPVPPPGSGWVLRVNDCAGLGTSFYTRALPVYDTNQSISNSTTRYLIYRIPTQTVDNGRRLLDVLQARLDETCNIDVKSRLFTQNVAGLPTYSNSVYDQKENVEHLIIFQRSDIKRPSALENATKGITTVKDILESLWATFRAYWWINDKGALVIEHESANTGQTPVNLTLSHPDQLKGTNKYESIQDDLPRGQYFGWDESYGDPDFDGLPLLYPNACSDGREDIQAGWSTDAGTLFSNGERGNDVGFVLIAALEVGTDEYGMTSELGALTGLSKLNGHLSWANLQAVYHQHRRPFINGLMNAAAHTFESRKPTKTQEVAVIVPEIDFEDLIAAIQDPPSRPRYTTGLGTGEMKAARYSVKNRTLTLEINHD